MHDFETIWRNYERKTKMGRKLHVRVVKSMDSSNDQKFVFDKINFFNRPEIPQIASNCVTVATFMIRHAMNFQKTYNHAWF